MSTFVVITQEAVQGFIRPALDLQTGEIIELATELAPVQLELFEPLDECIQGGHNAARPHCRNYLT
ncbi:hypothetical protein [Pseudomonas sp.]|uniref:hypothetical protein n=1 Tax=Pseudomonas sp. TaxID=306 RepID=UPI002FC5A875